MKDQLKDMEIKVTKILDDMIIQDFRYYVEDLHFYVKEKLGLDLKENHLTPKNTIKLIEYLDILLDSLKYKILLNTESLESSIEIKIDPSPKN